MHNNPNGNRYELQRDSSVAVKAPLVSFLLTIRSVSVSLLLLLAVVGSNFTRNSAPSFFTFALWSAPSTDELCDMHQAALFCYRGVPGCAAQGSSLYHSGTEGWAASVEARSSK